jgi:hypothetical protein
MWTAKATSEKSKKPVFLYCFYLSQKLLLECVQNKKKLSIIVFILLKQILILILIFLIFLNYYKISLC